MDIGAQIRRENYTVVLMVGDGGFSVNGGELTAVAQEKLPLILILFDDASYGILRGIQDTTYGRRVGVDLLSPDFVNLGESMGFKTQKVKSFEEFSSTSKSAIISKEPTLIVVDVNK